MDQINKDVVIVGTVNSLADPQKSAPSWPLWL